MNWRHVLSQLSYYGMAGKTGLEPVLRESESHVLPLHYFPINKWYAPSDSTVLSGTKRGVRSTPEGRGPWKAYDNQN